MEFEQYTAATYRRQGQKQQTESISFRLSKENLEKMRKDCEQKEISLNTLMSQIIEKYVNWDINASKVGIHQWIPFSKLVLKDLLENVAEQQLSKMAKEHAKLSVTETLMIMMNRTDLAAYLDFIGRWLKISNIPYIHEVDNGCLHLYIINHGLGKKWSIYFSEFINTIVEIFGTTTLRKTISDNTISFKVDTSRILEPLIVKNNNGQL